MRAVELELESEKATVAAARILGELLRQEPVGKTAFVLALEGELGAGKTTFVRGLAKGLGIREKITSPSFLIAKRYDVLFLDAARGKKLHRHKNHATTQPRNHATNLWHFDFYRLSRLTRRDLALLNFSDILRHPHNIVAIEWAERARRYLPRRMLVLKFRVEGRAKRQILVL